MPVLLRGARLSRNQSLTPTQGAALQTRSRTRDVETVLRSRSLFLRSWRPDVRQETFIANTAAGVVLAGLSETQTAVRSAANDLCVTVVLSVVFPEAHRADIEPAALREGPLAAR